MKIPCKYERLEDCSKEDLINKIIVRDKHCCDLKELLDKWLKKYRGLEEENRKLKESLDIATKCSCKEEDWIIRLSEENKKLKEELEWYKKQYEHSMGEC